MISEELAEVCGIHAGDGYLRNKGKQKEFQICGPLQEKEYYDKHVIPLVKKAFGVEISGRHFNGWKMYGFMIRDRKIIEEMHKLGFPYGKKGKLLRVPEEIQKGPRTHKVRFLRGFFDADGGLDYDKGYSGGHCAKMQDFHTYPRIKMTTISPRLSHNIITMLEEIGIRTWLQILRPRSEREQIKYIIWVRGKAVSLWMDTIGTKNPVQLTRYRIWKKFGFCPSKTTYEERIHILGNKVDIMSFYGPIV